MRCVNFGHKTKRALSDFGHIFARKLVKRVGQFARIGAGDAPRFQTTADVWQGLRRMNAGSPVDKARKRAVKWQLAIARYGDGPVEIAPG